MAETTTAGTARSHALPGIENAVVAIYSTHAAADAAVKAMQRAGFDMRKLSIVGADYRTEENVIGYYNAGDRVRYWGKLGAFWGGLAGILFGSAFLVLPVIGHLIVLGPLVSWIANGVAGAVVTGGMSALGAALYSIGIPKNSIVEYEAALKADKFLLVAHGTEEEVNGARETLATSGAERLDVHGSEAIEQEIERRGEAGERVTQ
jgi:hypothetical protein